MSLPPHQQQQSQHKNIRASAKQLLKRVENYQREQHGQSPTTERKRVVVDGKVYVEELACDDESDDGSFASCCEDEGQLRAAEASSEKHRSDASKGEGWVHLTTSAEDTLKNSQDSPRQNESCVGLETKCFDAGGEDDWEPLASPKNPLHSKDSCTSNDESQIIQAVHSQTINADKDKDKSENEKQEEHKDNPLLWIGGGLAVAGTVVGLAFANVKKKEHYENKAKHHRDS